MNGCQTSYLKLRNPTHLKVFAVQLIIFPAKDKIKNRKHHEKRIWYIYAIMRGHPGEMPTYKTDWSFHLYFVSSPNQCIIYATKKKKKALLSLSSARTNHRIHDDSTYLGSITFGGHLSPKAPAKTCVFPTQLSKDELITWFPFGTKFLYHSIGKSVSFNACFCLLGRYCNRYVLIHYAQ